MFAGSRKLSIWVYYAASVVVALISLALLAWYVNDRYQQFFTQQARTFLEDRAGIVAEQMGAGGNDTLAVDEATCQIPGSDPDTRLTIIDSGGVVLCDSQADVATMDNHGNRPEIRQAFSGKISSVTRYSNTLSATLLYVAVPVVEESSVVHVVRAAIPMSSIDNLLLEVRRTIVLAGILMALAALGMTVVLYRKINPPLKDIVKGANRFAQGRFSTKLPTYDVKEISDLAAAMNRMADQLQHLETVRQDFVANVSHELKTPITSIKGFVETLNDGAKLNEEDLDRFLNIILKQSNRLEAIVEDLLTLSRLESEPASELLSLSRENLGSVLTSVRDYCLSRAEAKRIDISVGCNPKVEVLADRSLLTQALINLVDNAIKYSDEDTRVEILGSERQNSVRIDVTDEGPGISADHIPRLFERFYRVDKARSRTLGGTGLGLAIVKHVTGLHSGEVSVESKPGQGSTFSIDLPKAPADKAFN